MRIHIVAFLILISCLNVFSTVSAQKISLQFKQVELETVFKAIERQTDYGFAYGVALLANSEPVTVQLKDVTLAEALDHIFANLPYKYEIVNKTILIKAKPVSNQQPTSANNKPIRISGKVTDIRNNPLIGVSIRLRGTNVGTITDQNGNYQIDGDSDGILLFSFVGFQAMQIRINNQKEINLTLIEYTSKLEETVIRGYYSISKELNTGSISSINAKDISKQPVGDPIAALQGRIAGLNIQQVTGLPGANFKVQLRGQNSIANGNDPLYIVDGVPFESTPLTNTTFGSTIGHSPLNNINIADIEEITVLKDADATAIYGSMGANGVILITTKKGKSGQTGLSANYYTGVGSVTRKLNLLNTNEYLEMRHEAFKNDNRNPTAIHLDVNGAWDSTKYTDWQDVFIGGTAKINDAQVRFSGGSNLTQFTLGVGYRKETTVFPGDYYDQKGSMQAGFNHASENQKFQLSFSTNYNRGNNVMPESDFVQYIKLAPNAPDLFGLDGKLNWNGWTTAVPNPFSQLYKRNRAVTSNFQTNANVSYEIFSDLKLSARFGYSNRAMKQNIIIPAISAVPPDDNNPLRRINRFMDNSLDTWIIEPQVTYTKYSKAGQFDFLFGTTFRSTNQKILTQSATGFVSDALIENINAATNFTTAAFKSTKYRYHAIFGRIGYALAQKYILNLTGRRDGSSRFGPDKQFGNFGAIGTAWLFSKEDFFKSVLPYVTFGKIRFSYGITGNDQLTDYQFLSTYESGSYAYFGNNGLLPTRLTNPDFSWETVRKFETGLELGLFSNSVQFNVNYYRNITNDQLVGYPLSYLTGFSSIQANLPAKIRNTGWEFEVVATAIIRNRFRWDISGNVSVPKNKLLSFPDLENHPSYSSKYKEGYSLDSRYLFHNTGINPTNGLYTFEDVDGDGKISYDLDRRFYERKQRFYGGINNDFSYRGFSLSLNVQFSRQDGNRYLYLNTPGVYNVNQPISVTDRWTKPGDENLLRYSTLPRTEHELFNISDGILGDASFLRLKNVMVSWSLKNEYTRKLRIKELRIFSQCQNLFTLTKYRGLDPENGSSSLTLPPLRVITAGINISL